MEAETRTYIRLGIILNTILLLATALLLLRYFQPQALASMTGQMAGPMVGMGRGMGNGMGMGRGNGSGMGNGNGTGPSAALRQMHQAPIPADYLGLTNPVAADAASLARGAEAYQLYCVACHGATGMGDGVAAATLDPAPAPIARTSQMMGDDYLFWRISEGGAHFTTAMPAWEGAIAEATRWDLVNYMRSLGTGQTGGGMDPAAEAARQAEMVNAALAQKLITQAEADLFSTVHTALDSAMRADATLGGTGTMFNRQQAALATLVQQGTITQADADTFLSVRDRLLSMESTQ